MGRSSGGVDGFIAAGWTSDDTDDADDDVGLWRSADGRSWSALSGPASFSSASDQWISSVAAIEDGYILAGNNTISGQVLPVLWLGSGDVWGQVVVGEDTTDMTGLEMAVSTDTVVVVGRRMEPSGFIPRRSTR